MIATLEALFDISLAIAGAALTVAVFAFLVELAVLVRRHATVLFHRQHASVRMQ